MGKRTLVEKKINQDEDEIIRTTNLEAGFLGFSGEFPGAGPEEYSKTLGVLGGAGSFTEDGVPHLEEARGRPSFRGNELGVNRPLSMSRNICSSASTAL